MSSFSKNIIPRRAHRERLQPQHRTAKHGLLEKKKDYKLRARDANRKAYRLKLLREKAAFRNPDEFYHAMENAAPTKDGRVRRVRDPKVAENHHTADGEVRRLVETQDRAYVQMKRSRERAKISSIKQSIHFLDAAAVDDSRRHAVFVDDEDEDNDHAPVGRVEQTNESISGEEQHIHADHGINDANEVDEEDVIGASGKARRQAKKKSRKTYQELSQRVDRVTRLNSALEDLALRHNLLSKGSRRKVRPGNPGAGIPPVFKWRKQRKA